MWKLAQNYGNYSEHNLAKPLTLPVRSLLFQERADENVSKADAHSAARTLLAFLNIGIDLQ